MDRSKSPNGQYRVANELSRQPKDVPKNPEDSHDLLKNVLQRFFEKNAISTTVSDLSATSKLVIEYAHDHEYAHDPEFQLLCIP